MREKMLGISRRLRGLADEPGIQMITPQELLQEIADIIDEELEGNRPISQEDVFGQRFTTKRTSIGAQAMGIDKIKNEQ